MKPLLVISALLATTATSFSQLVGIDYNFCTMHNEFGCVDPFLTGTTVLLNSFDFSSGFWSPGTVGSDPSVGIDYALSSDYTLYTFNASSGSILTAASLDTYMQAINSPSSGQFVGIDYNGSTLHNKLRSINPVTGTTTWLNSFDFSSGGWYPDTFRSDPSAGIVYAISADNTLYAFNASSGIIGSMVNLNTLTPIVTIDRASSGQLIGIGYNSMTSQWEFRRIDPLTGATTLLNSFNFSPGVYTYTFRSDPSAGKAYIISYDAKLYTFDVSSGLILTVTSLDSSIQAIAIGPGPCAPTPTPTPTPPTCNGDDFFMSTPISGGGGARVVQLQ